MHAFAETYLSDAMGNLAEAVDYSVNACGFCPDEFNDAFLASGLAAAWEAGSPKVLAGMSGTELAQNAFARIGRERPWPEPLVTALDRSPEFWAGWVLAYYQWYSARRFGDIRRVLPISRIVKLYTPLHEASENRFVDRAESFFKAGDTRTRLKCRRELAGMSQSDLARRASVNIRNIQQYEQRVKDINRAAGATLQAMATVLGCRIEDILEPDVPPTP